MEFHQPVNDSYGELELKACDILAAYHSTYPVQFIVTQDGELWACLVNWVPAKASFLP